MRAILRPKAITLEYDVLGAYCGLSTASEMFLIFDIQINAQSRHL